MWRPLRRGQNRSQLGAATANVGPAPCTNDTSTGLSASYKFSDRNGPDTPVFLLRGEVNKKASEVGEKQEEYVLGSEELDEAQL